MVCVLHDLFVMMDITAMFVLGRKSFFIIYYLDFIVSTVKCTILLIITYVLVNYISHFQIPQLYISQRVIPYGSVELVTFCKVPSTADRRLSSVPDETLLLHWTPYMDLTHTDRPYNSQRLWDTVNKGPLSCTCCHLRSCHSDHSYMHINSCICRRHV